MIARIVSYPAESLEDATEWARERGPALRQQDEIEHAYFMTSEDPPRAAAILLYASREALEAYLDSEAYRQAVREIREGWGKSGEPIREDVYELLDV